MKTSLVGISTNRKIVAAGTVVLLLAFLISLTPWYHAYMTYDYKWTCAKFRKNIQWNYEAILSDAASPDAADAESALADAVKSTNRGTEYELEQIDAQIWHISGICRDGGTFVVTIGGESRITVDCDHAGHDKDYTQLPEYVQK